MKFLGYYPGVDFTDSSQFGRLIHTKKFLESYTSSIDDDSIFIVGRRGTYEHPNIMEIGFGQSYVSKVIRDIVGLFILFYHIIKTDEKIVIYCRDSPYISKLVVAGVSTVEVVVEVNGVSQSEGDESSTRSRIYSWIRYWTRHFASLIIAVSSSIKSQLNEIHQSKNIFVVENGVDTDLFSPSDTVTSSSDITVCYVGGLQEWQRVDLMLGVLAEMDDDVTFLVVGGTAERCAWLHREAKKRNLTENTEIVGRVEYEEVPNYINQSDVCFGPFNQEREASPMKIYEYLACAKPVILINDVGLEYVDEYPGVYRCRSSQSNMEIANKTMKVASENGENGEGRRFVERNHSWDSVTSAVSRLIEEEL